MTFTQAFKPALNKEGYSRLTFKGYEIKEGQTKKRKNEDGTIEEPRDWKMLCFNFEVKGSLRGTFKDIAISTNFVYDSDNLLGRTLAGLGFSIPENSTVEDEEGFEVEDLEIDDEGFNEEEEVDLGIEDFLKEIVDNVYIAELYKPTEGKQKGYWQINVETLKLFKTKDGKTLG